MVLESSEAFRLREPGVSYHINFGPKNDDIGTENGYRDTNPQIALFAAAFLILLAAAA